MARTARRLNFLVDEEVCQELETLVPPGKRSRVVNEALRRELEIIRRGVAAEALGGLARNGKQFANIDIVAALARDRGGH